MDQEITTKTSYFGATLYLFGKAKKYWNENKLFSGKANINHESRYIYINDFGINDVLRLESVTEAVGS